MVLTYIFCLLRDFAFSFKCAHVAYLQHFYNDCFKICPNSRISFFLVLASTRLFYSALVFLVLGMSDFWLKPQHFEYYETMDHFKLCILAPGFWKGMCANFLIPSEGRLTPERVLLKIPERGESSGSSLDLHGCVPGWRGSGEGIRMPCYGSPLGLHWYLRDGVGWWR